MYYIKIIKIDDKIIKLDVKIVLRMNIIYNQFKSNEKLKVNY